MTTRSPDPDPRATAVDAWRAWCAGLADVGETVLTDPLVTGERDLADGLRHLARQLVFATQWHLEFDDPERPALYRSNDDVTPWGGPNADNTYLRARIDPAGTYRLRADVTGCRDLIIAVSEGDMSLGRPAVHHEIGARDLHPAGGHLDLVIAPHPPVTDTGEPFTPGARVGGSPVDWLRTHPDSTLLTIRVYVIDWDRDRVPDFTLERLDLDPGPAPPLTLEAVTGHLDDAAQWMAVGIPFWLRFLELAAGAAEPNVLSPPRRPEGGALTIAYGAGFWDLDAEHAWLITVEPPRAEQWSIQTHTWPWFESGDLAARQTSLNSHQVHLDPDGRARIVVSGRDPGVPNWLDTEGRATGMVVYRWIATRDDPTPSSLVVPLADLAAHLPPDHPTVTPDERRRNLTRRRLAVQRRFRR